MNIRLTAKQVKQLEKEGRIEPAQVKKPSKPKKDHPLVEELNTRKKGSLWRFGLCRMFTTDARSPTNTAMTTAKDNALICWYEGEAYMQPRVRFIGWLWESKAELLRRAEVV